jgi:hypothetical protein
VVFQFLKCGNFMHFQNSLKNKNLVEPTHQRLPPSTSSGIWATCCCCPRVPACIHVGDRCHRQLPSHRSCSLIMARPQCPSIPSPLTFLTEPRSSSCLRSTRRHRASIRVMNHDPGAPPSLSPLSGVSHPILQAKPNTHCMCAQDHLFHTHEYKVFTDSQMS